MVVPYLRLSCVTHGDKIARSKGGEGDPGWSKSSGKDLGSNMTSELPSCVVLGKSLKVLMCKMGEMPIS